MYKNIFIYLCVSFILCAQNSSSIKKKKKKVDFLINFFTIEKYLPQLDAEGYVTNLISDYLNKLFVYEQFAVKGATIIRNPLKKSLEDAREKLQKEMPVTSLEEFEKELVDKYDYYKTGNRVKVPIIDGTYIEGTVRTITDDKLYLENQSISFDSILRPEKLLYKGEEGKKDYVKLLAGIKIKDESLERDLRFKELQTAFLKEYLDLNKKSIAFPLSGNNWGTVYEYINWKVSERKKKLVIKRVLQPNQLDIATSDSLAKDKGNLLSERGFVFQYIENSEKIKDILISYARIEKQRKELVELTEEQKKQKNKELLRNNRNRHGNKLLQINNNSTNTPSVTLDILISLLVGVVVSFFLFITLSKIPIFRTLFSNKSKAINLSSLEEKIGKK